MNRVEKYQELRFGNKIFNAFLTLFYPFKVLFIFSVINLKYKESFIICRAYDSSCDSGRPLMVGLVLVAVMGANPDFADELTLVLGF